MPTVTEIAESVRAMGQRIIQQMNAYGWSPSVPISQHLGISGFTSSAEQIAKYCDIVAFKVERLTKAQLETDGFGLWLAKMQVQVDAQSFGQVNQANSLQVPSAIALIQMLETAIPAVNPKEPKVNWEDLKGEKSLLPRDLTSRLRSVESRLTDLKPRSKEINQKIADIENDHAAAEQLPTDLAELKERRFELDDLISQAHGLADLISEDSKAVTEKKKEFEVYIEDRKKCISDTLDRAIILLSKSEHALRGATEVGLSKSFESRKRSLSLAGTAWTAGLAISLCVAVLIGWERVGALKDVLTGEKSAVVVIVNAILALMGIGAPVWFAWLATKQIGTSFRLAEDYAFKASVAQAYEGYRTEALDMDDELRHRLFSAALDRFEEAPIRLVDPKYHSSPMQEALNNSTIQSAIGSVSSLPGQISKVLKRNGEENLQIDE